MNHKGKRLVVCYNEERAGKDKAYRERHIEKLKEKLKGVKNIKQLISNAHDRKFIKMNDEKTKASLDIEKVKQDELYLSLIHI